MEYKDVRDLIKSNFKPVPGINFEDTHAATVNAICEYYGLTKLSPREIKANRNSIMALIEEVIDEILPDKLKERVEDFAEVKTYARDEEVVFKISKKGKRRAFLSIKKGQRGGLYQAARLDNVYMSLPTWVETVSVFVTLEEILLGKTSLVELMNNILDGFVEKLYVKVVEALQATNPPAANQGSAAGIDNDELDRIIRIVSSYGSPVIMGFHSTISKIHNMVEIDGANPNIPTSDIDEIRSRGYVGIYKGTPIVKLPNYIIDEETNDRWLLEEDKLFILPASEKPVKVALKGDMYIKPIVHPSGSEEENAHKILGVGLLLNNNIGIYTDTTETSEE